jgi:hypothetical protein
MQPLHSIERTDPRHVGVLALVFIVWMIGNPAPQAQAGVGLTPTAVPTLTPTPTCPCGFPVSGRVAAAVDCSGGVEGIEVILEPAGRSTLSGGAPREGYFTFEGAFPGAYRLVTSPRCGAVGCWGPTRVSVGNTGVEVTMCPTDPHPGDSGHDDDGCAVIPTSRGANGWGLLSVGLLALLRSLALHPRIRRTAAGRRASGRRGGATGR